MDFISGLNLPEGKTKNWWFAFSNNRILVEEQSSGIKIPFLNEAEWIGTIFKSRHFFGNLDGNPCYSGEIDENFKIPEGFALKDLRSLVGKISNDLLFTAGRAFQLNTWDLTSNYCSQCGKPVILKPDEWAKICPECGNIKYHSANPAIMVAVHRDDKILLARSHNQPPDFFSVLAGFLEPGESMEECVKREVKEEVNINIKNIKYFGSQPYSPSNSIMIAFTAEYDSGEIEIDKSEIDTAGWFTKDNIPEITPPSFFLAGQLIKAFVSR